MEAFKSKRFTLRLVLSMVVIWLITSVVFSQQAHMTSKEFEKWVIDNANAQLNSSQSPRFCQMAIERLRSDEYVTDLTILRCVEAFVVAADRDAKAGRGAAARERYNQTFGFIEQVEPLLNDRVSLRAQLLAREGSLWSATGEEEKAVKAYEASLNFIEPQRLRADLERQKILVGLGHSLLTLNRRKEAESYFLTAMSYPWYTIVNRPNELQALRDQYILAGYGLIESRRGNLAALAEIMFIPATREQLGPALEKAINEAKERR